MKLLTPVDRPNAPRYRRQSHVLEQHLRKRRVQSPHRDISPVPSFYSEPISLRHRKGVAGELPWIDGCSIWEDDDKTQSLKSVHCGRRAKRSRGFTKMSDLKLPPVSVDSNKMRCGLVVRGSSYPRACIFPPICEPRSTQTQSQERPPSRAEKRAMKSDFKGEDKGDRDPPDMTTENLPNGQRPFTHVLAKDGGSVGTHSSAKTDVLVKLGISISTGLGGRRDCLPLKPRGWKELWQEMVPQEEGVRLPTNGHQHGQIGWALPSQSCDRKAPAGSDLPPSLMTGRLQPKCLPYWWRPACRCSSPRRPCFLQVPSSSNPSTPAGCLPKRTVELASSNGGSLPKITMTCPTPKILS